MAKTQLEKLVDDLQQRVRRLERAQPDPITIVADNGAELNLGTMPDGTFGIRIRNSDGALIHTFVVS